MADAAIIDYDRLVSEVKTWCARSDSTFSNRFPVFVALAESRIYLGHGKPGDALYSAPLRSKVMETEGTITLTSGKGTIPADAVHIRRIFRDGDQEGIIYAPPHLFSTMNASAVNGANPYYYTVEGSTLRVTPSMDTNLSILYYKRFDAITLTNKTGPLIEEHGTLYFKAVMAYAMTFMQDMDGANVWLNEYRAAVDGINKVAGDIRTGAQRVRSVTRAIG